MKPGVLKTRVCQLQMRILLHILLHILLILLILLLVKKNIKFLIFFIKNNFPLLELAINYKNFNDNFIKVYYIINYK